MTCPNATAPRDISNNVDAICNLKCDYSFAYPNSVLQVTNHQTYLSMLTDKAQSTAVRYNASNYDVTEIRLYQPSLHTYRGQPAEAELIIMHSNLDGRGSLLVCVPIKSMQNGTSSNSIQLFDQIMSKCAKTANAVGQQTVINLTSFTLNAFVPMKPFYSYRATLPFAPCNGKVHYVVFDGSNESFMMVSSDAIQSLKNLIKVHDYTTKSTGDISLFMNKTGAKPLNVSKGENIYIECNPTDADGQVLVPNNQTSAQIFNMSGLKGLLQNVLFQAIFGILIIVLIMKVCKFLLDKLVGNKVVASNVNIVLKQTGGRGLFFR